MFIYNEEIISRNKEKLLLASGPQNLNTVEKKLTF